MNKIISFNSFYESDKEDINKQTISNSYDELDEDRILFEKKIKFLILLKHLNLFDFNSKYIEIDTIEITRTDVKNYLESFNIKYNLDWINSVLPNKVINFIKIPEHYDIYNEIESDVEYQKKHELIKEIFSNMNNESKLYFFDKIFDKIFNTYYITDNDIIQIYIEKYGPKNYTDLEIINFFDKIFGSSIYDINHLIDYIDTNIKKIKSNEVSSPTGFWSYGSFWSFIGVEYNITWIERFEYFKNNSKFGYKISVNNYICNHINKRKIKEIIFNDVRNDNFTENEKIKFVNYYFNKHDLDVIKIPIDSKLDYDSHYELYKLDEKKYIEILFFNNPIEDLIGEYYFVPWKFDNYDFLNKFNEKVQNYLKTKIRDDSNNNRHIENKSITSLDDYIDIMYFIHNPPLFLRLHEWLYIPEYISLIDEYAKDFKFNFEKTNYLNMKPKIVYEK